MQEPDNVIEDRTSKDGCFIILNCAKLYWRLGIIRVAVLIVDKFIWETDLFCGHMFGIIVATLLNQLS